MISKKDRLKRVGQLSHPSKMPCKAYSLPADECKVGSELRKIKNSTCSGCYAHKGFYVFGPVQRALYRRLKAIYEPTWVEDMSEIIKGMPFFRWHDSGDIQNELHLDKICRIAINCPTTKFWLPTREWGIVKNYLKNNKRPGNLTIRLSATMIDDKGPEIMAKQLGLCVSEVRTINYNCPASKQDNKCVNCRKCWDNNVFIIAYKKH